MKRNIFVAFFILATLVTSGCSVLPNTLPPGNIRARVMIEGNAPAVITIDNINTYSYHLPYRSYQYINLIDPLNQWPQLMSGCVAKYVIYIDHPGLPDQYTSITITYKNSDCQYTLLPTPTTTNIVTSGPDYLIFVDGMQHLVTAKDNGVSISLFHLPKFLINQPNQILYTYEVGEYTPITTLYLHQ